MILTKQQLSAALFFGAPLKANSVVTFKTVNAVEREDGSGLSYNITGSTTDGRTVTVHVRTSP